jgi:hypothetical protein
MLGKQYKTLSWRRTVSLAYSYVLLPLKCIIGITSHPGAAVTAPRLRVGVLPLGGAHVIRDHTAGDADHSAIHVECVVRP